ncbi:flagellar hook-basal body complex subunit FliE [Pirellula staleyi DSM 6068]|uniref:Flagellar hook-basal body complex protein FliE n=1 Tax=Pirellula staleyi (strain ATCC 27377 / DSM 6068 / ICPB 4128) TaxID=530564 RepID=D2R524_PIRSD|nr:flagellar hook-basal body complex protein FliE [Pirellula staleyi]ADB18986.1 flagellar hook-basal body complex subunit FliE [Pirellula staleyi DSM 6068]
MTSIQGLSLPIPLSPPSTGAIGGAEQTGGAQPFKNVLLEALDQVNNVQHDADQAVQQLVTGGDVNPAEVLTTLQKADMSFRMMMQIRNKLVQAYQEVSNIRI